MQQNEIIVITGHQGTGKTMLADRMTRAKNPVMAFEDGLLQFVKKQKARTIIVEGLNDLNKIPKLAKQKHDHKKRIIITTHRREETMIYELAKKSKIELIIFTLDRLPTYYKPTKN